MKKNILTAAILFTLLLAKPTLHAQIPSWQWAISAGQYNAEDYGSHMTIDPSGNVYVIGSFASQTLTFGTTTLTNGTTPSLSDNTDIFVVKFNASGTVLWTRSVHGIYFEGSRGIAVDHNGNVYITGVFNSPTLFIGTIGLTNAGSDSPFTTPHDIFIAKYDANGNVLWAKSNGSTGDDNPSALCLDAAGNVYVTGSFNSPLLIFGNTTLTPVGGGDVFLAKYDTNGNALWARSAGGPESDGGADVTSTGGNVYITGSSSSPSIAFGSTTLTGPDWFTDFLVAGYDSTGNLLWAKRAGGVGWDVGSAVTTDGSSLYLAGHFEGVVSFGTSTLTSQSTRNSFIAKYDLSGNAVWAKNSGGVYGASGISTDGSGNVYTAAIYEFFAKYDPLGNMLWKTALSSTVGLVDVRDITVNAYDDVFITGAFRSTVTLGNITLTNPDASRSDFFVAKSDKTIGLAEFDHASTFQTYPNPFSSRVTMKFKKQLYNATVVLYNSHGQVVRELKNISGESYVIDRHNLPAGIYYCVISEDHEITQSAKLIVTD